MALKTIADFVNLNNFPHRIREMPLQSELNEEAAKLQKILEQGGGKASLKTLAYAALADFLKDYPKNRGRTGLDQSRIFSWYDSGLIPEAMGEFPICLDNNLAMLVGHHHRTAFAVLLYWMSKNWDVEKNLMFSVRVVEPQNFVKTYAALDLATIHPKEGKLKNSDLLTGSVVSCDPQDPGVLGKMLTVTALEEMNRCGGHLPQVAAILYAMQYKTGFHKKERINFLDDQYYVYQCRKRVDPLIRLARIEENLHLFSPPSSALKAVAVAIEDYCVFRRLFCEHIEAAKNAGQNISIMNKVVSLTAFYSYYITDKAIFHRLPKAEKVAENLNHFGPLGLYDDVISLWNNDKRMIMKRVERLDNKLSQVHITSQRRKTA